MVSNLNEPSRRAQVIAIDGPAGAGKSTVARQLAKRLGFAYLDTGAMYRALTLKALRQHVTLDNEDQLVEVAKQTTIDLKDDAQGVHIFLDGEDVSEEIRSAEVTNNTFYIAPAPRIREIMVQWQRDIGGRRNVVIEGRDVGTVVFPDASTKFFLDADFNERSQRRISELKEKGQNVNEEELAESLQERDNKDRTRSVGPLKKAEDAILIDTTSLSIDEVVGEMLKCVS